MSQQSKTRRYVVTFRESAVVTEMVMAHSAAEAVELMRVGEGERVGFEIDETRDPTHVKARLAKADE